MSNACDSHESSGFERRVDPARGRVGVRADRVDLGHDGHGRAGLGGREGGPLAGQSGADDQNVVCGHGGAILLKWVGHTAHCHGPVRGANADRRRPRRRAVPDPHDRRRTRGRRWRSWARRTASRRRSSSSTRSRRTSSCWTPGCRGSTASRPRRCCSRGGRSCRSCCAARWVDDDVRRRAAAAGIQRRALQGPVRRDPRASCSSWPSADRQGSNAAAVAADHQDVMIVGADASPPARRLARRCCCSPRPWRRSTTRRRCSTGSMRATTTHRTTACCSAPPCSAPPARVMRRDRAGRLGGRWGSPLALWGARQPLLDLRARRPRGGAVPVDRRRALAGLPARRPTSRLVLLIRQRIPHARLAPVARRRDRRADRRRGERGGRVRRGQGDDRRRHRRGRDQPGLPARRHGPDRHRDRRDDRRARPARPDLAVASAPASACSRSPTRSTSSRSPRAPTSTDRMVDLGWPLGALLDRPVGVAARGARAAARRAPAAQRRHAGRAVAREPRDPRLRPLRPHEPARARPRHRVDRRDDHPALPDPSREPRQPRHEPPPGAHRRAHRARQPLRADGRRWSTRSRTATPHVLLLFDLDGFKNYNDSYGHPAGDALLARLGSRLAAATDGRRPAPTASAATSSACWATGRRGRALEPLIARARAALSEEGDGFSVGASCGHALLHEEAADAAEAHARRRPPALRGEEQRPRLRARIQSAQVLRRALEAWDAELGEHTSDVAALAATGGAAARARRRGGRADRDRRRAARHRQDRDPALDPAQARARSTRRSGRSCAATR